VSPGEPYEAPPLLRSPGVSPLFEVELAPLAAGDASALSCRRAAKALRGAEPLLPLLVADSFVAEAAAARWTSPAALAAHLLERTRGLLASIQNERETLDEVFAYFDNGRLLQAHVVPLQQFAAFGERRAPELFPFLAGAATEQASKAGNAGFIARRDGLRVRVAKRRAVLALERGALESAQAGASEVDRLRVWGDLLYAHAAEVPPRATGFAPPSAPDVTIALDPELDAKGNAAAIFKRYRKAVGRRAHAERRLIQLDVEERAVETLAWEVERAVPETLDELRTAVDGLERRKPQRSSGPAPRGKRRHLEIALAADARAFVGRSPSGNAELTFRVARPDDLWFHARNIPGAHVVLRLDAGREPSDAELQAAAALAAFHSKARTAERVEVDYTRRKYVRKQAGGAPGLVWYTHARTLLVAPKDPALA
jgi:predicted ribosome quality control (RQC) complex YloA/Tae2 family protein